MKILISFLILLFFIFSNASLAQFPNLVPNPGFEDFIPGDSICNINQLLLYPYQFPGSAEHWFKATRDHVLYSKKCLIETQPGTYLWYNPRQGEAFVRLVVYDGAFLGTNLESRRNYPEVELTNPLTAGCRYKAELHYLLSAYSHTSPNQYQTSDGLGIYFSTERVLVDTTIGPLHWLTPQIENPSGNLLGDTGSYQKFTGYFVASGGEKFMTIGNFRTNEETQYGPLTPGYDLPFTAFYIDDVSLTLAPPEGLELNLGPDTAICSTHPFSIDLKANPGFENYLWSTGDTTEILTVTEPGEYWMRADFGCGYLYDTIVVNSLPPPPAPSAINDSVICHQNPFSVTLKAPPGFVKYTWNSKEVGSSYVVKQPGINILEAYHPCFTWKDTISITVFDQSVRYILPFADTSICEGTSIKISTLPGFSRFQWSNGQTGKSIEVGGEDKYKVSMVSREGCNVQDSIQINVIKAPAFPLLPPDTISCKGLAIAVNVNALPPYTEVFWDDSTRSATRTFNNNGVYSVKAINSCFNVEDSITIQLLDCTPIIPNLITPNQDGKNDNFKINTEVARPFVLEIYNRWGSRIYYSSHYKNDWEASDLSDGIYFYNLKDVLLQKNYKGVLQVVR